MTSSYYIDESRLRLAWVIPFSLVLWAAMLTVFAMLLEETAPPPPELAPAQVRIVEVPPPAGLQGGAVKHPAALAKPKAETPNPHPHLRVKRAAAPPVKIHAVKPKTPALMPPSPSGTAKESNEPNEAKPGSEATTATPGAGAGPGVGGGAGVGSDSSGARAIYAPKPIIPDSLREEAFETVAVAHFTVNGDGQVQVTLTRPTENPELNEILLDTLKQWRFFPAMKSGVAINSQFDVRIPITVQ